VSPGTSISCCNCEISELTSGTGRSDEEIPYADCYACARPGSKQRPKLS
jgi:hypothetical protein